MDMITQLKETLDGTAGAERVDQLIKISAHYRQQSLIESERYAQAALDLAQSLNYKTGEANGHIRLGWIAHRRNLFSEAESHFLAALQLFLTSGDSEKVADANHYLGLTLSRQPIRRNEALQYFQRALHIRQKHGNQQNICLSLDGIAHTYYYSRQYEKALETHLKCLKIREDIQDNEHIGISLNGIGATYFDWGEPENARPYFLRSIEVFRRTNNQSQLAAALLNLGNVYAAQNKLEDARKYWLDSIHIREEIGELNDAVIVYNNIGASYQEEELYNKALTYHHKALEIIQAEKTQSIDSVITCQLIGNAKIFLGNYDAAADFLNQALELNRSHGDKICELDIYKSMRTLYERTQDFKRCVSFFHKIVALEREIFNKEKNQQIASIRTRYEMEKKVQELMNYREQLKLLTKHMSRKNKIIEDLQRKILKIETPSDPICRVKMEEIMTYIDQSKSAREEWVDFRLYFDQVFPTFLQRLTDTYPRLTRQELKTAALIKAELTTKQIAQTLHIAYRSAHNLRNRLRKKMSLSPDITLNNFLRDF